MDFYTIVLRKSNLYWVALCLENGIVGQGKTKETAIEKLREAVLSFEEAQRTEGDIYTSALSIGELHEFLTVEGEEPSTEAYELRAVHA